MRNFLAGNPGNLRSASGNAGTKENLLDFIGTIDDVNSLARICGKMCWILRDFLRSPTSKLGNLGNQSTCPALAETSENPLSKLFVFLITLFCFSLLVHILSFIIFTSSCNFPIGALHPISTLKWSHKRVKTCTFYL